MDWTKARKKIEIILLAGIFIGIVILIIKYTQINNLTTYLQDGNITPLIDYWQRETGEQCICFIPLQ